MHTVHFLSLIKYFLSDWIGGPGLCPWPCIAVLCSAARLRMVPFINIPVWHWVQSLQCELTLNWRVLSCFRQIIWCSIRNSHRTVAVINDLPHEVQSIVRLFNYSLKILKRILRRLEMMGLLGWPWHQLDSVQTACTSLSVDNHANATSLIFMGQLLFLMPNQQCQLSMHWSLAEDWKKIWKPEICHAQVVWRYKHVHVLPSHSAESLKMRLYRQEMLSVYRMIAAMKTFS